MPSENPVKQSKAPKKATYSAASIANLALKGLLTELGGEAEWNRMKAHSDDKTHTAGHSLCAEVLAAAEKIGQAIHAEDRPNNQFALYNLAHSRTLLKSLSELRGSDRTCEQDVKETAKPRKDSVNLATSAMAIFQQEISTFAAYTDDSSSDETINISSSLTKYFTRENFKMTKHVNYGIVLFFLIGLATRTDYKFAEDKVLNASPAIHSVFLEAQKVLSDENATPALICEHVVDALGRGRIAQLSHIYLGGLLEVGTTDVKNLWRHVFGENPKHHEKLSTRESAEMHYVGYRLTSSEQDVELLKSFLVFQAPGYVRGGAQTRREHFALKAFTNYESGKMRSVGAVVELGDEIVAFASRRKQEDDVQPGLLNPAQFRGATMLSFNKVWFNAGNGILLGMLMTTNQKSRNMSCPIICVRSDTTHSSNAGLGIIGRDQLVNDLCQHTWLKAGKDADTEALADYIWKTLLSRPADNVTFESEGGSSDCTGCPPIVSPDITPRGLKNEFINRGFLVENR